MTIKTQSEADERDHIKTAKTSLTKARSSNSLNNAYKSLHQQQQSLSKSNLINYINFNQDYSCVSIGLKDGYKIFNVKPFGRCFNKSDGSIGIIEMLFCTSLVVVVGLGEQHHLTPRRLKIINTKRQSVIVELTFPSTILSIKMNKSRLIVLLEEQIYVYDIANMRLLHTIETSPNANGLCALSSNESNNYLAYPSSPKAANVTNEGVSTTATNTNVNSLPSNRTGDVIIFNAETLQPLSVIEAHKSTLACLTLSSDGLLLATASDKGTIIRVFSIETGVKLFQFRRGTYPTKIYNINFSNDNRFLTVTSSTETVHIFRLGEEESISFKSRKTKSLSSTPIQEETESGIKRQAGQHDADDNSSEEDYSDEDVEDPDMDELTEPSALRFRRLSQGSNQSFNSNNSEDPMKEPIIDNSRKSVARMIRRSSQTLGRKAAERMGIYLPSRFSSILEPTRHFASLKIPNGNNKDLKSISAIGEELELEEIASIASESSANRRLLNVMVVTSDGFFYNYGLDTERGGDCILLNQYSLTATTDD